MHDGQNDFFDEIVVSDGQSPASLITCWRPSSLRHNTIVGNLKAVLQYIQAKNSVEIMLMKLWFPMANIWVRYREKDVNNINLLKLYWFQENAEVKSREFDTDKTTVYGGNVYWGCGGNVHAVYSVNYLRQSISTSEKSFSPDLINLNA